jgi:hypothetical protein
MCGIDANFGEEAANRGAQMYPPPLPPTHSTTRIWLYVPTYLPTYLPPCITRRYPDNMQLMELMQRFMTNARAVMASIGAAANGAGGSVGDPAMQQVLVGYGRCNSRSFSQNATCRMSGKVVVQNLSYSIW